MCRQAAFLVILVILVTFSVFKCLLVYFGDFSCRDHQEQASLVQRRRGPLRLIANIAKTANANGDLLEEQKVGADWRRKQPGLTLRSSCNPVVPGR